MIHHVKMSAMLTCGLPALVQLQTLFGMLHLLCKKDKLLCMKGQLLMLIMGSLECCMMQLLILYQFSPDCKLCLC